MMDKLASMAHLADEMPFGMELEVADGAAGMLASLGFDRLHSYHCGEYGDCEQCDPHRPSPDWTAQADCTADGEFISRILRWGSTEADRAIDNLGRMLTENRVGVGGDVGNHVHVGRERLDDEPGARTRLWALFLKHVQELEWLGQAQRRRMRGYNHPPEGRYLDDWKDESFRVRRAYTNGSWLAAKTDTVEFRLWNSTRTPWRLRMHAGLSVGMVTAAIYGPKPKDDGRTFLEDVGPYLDEQTIAGYFKQALVATNRGESHSRIGRY